MDATAARPSGLLLLRVLLSLRLLRDALAEGIRLVLVRAVLLLERGRVGLALVLALLGGIHLRLHLALLGLLGLLVRLLRDALAERVLLVLAGPVLLLERGRVGLALGLAVLGRVCVRGLLVRLVLAGAVRDALAEGVVLVLVGPVGVPERLCAHRRALGATLLLGVRLRGAAGCDGRSCGHQCQGTKDRELAHANLLLSRGVRSRTHARGRGWVDALVKQVRTLNGWPLRVRPS